MMKVDGEEVDGEEYWYQVAQALVVDVARRHLPFDAVMELVQRVEKDAAAGFEHLERDVGRVVCLEGFQGLRDIILGKEERSNDDDGS